MNTDLFQSSGHCWVFQICWYIECCTFTGLSFRIWNSSTGIPSPLLAFFVVMLPKAHLTLPSGMSGSRWVTTPGYLHQSVYLPFLLNIFCFCYVHIISVLYCAHLCMRWSLASLISLKRSLVFPILLFSSISFHCSLRKAFLPLLAVLWNSAFRWLYLSFSPLPLAFLLFSAICKASLRNHFPFAFLFLGAACSTKACNTNV